MLKDETNFHSAMGDMLLIVDNTISKLISCGLLEIITLVHCILVISSDISLLFIC
jgi:hypothetical protein